MSFTNTNDNNLENTGRRRGDAFTGSADPFTTGDMDAAFSSTPDDGLNVTSRSGGMGRKGINVADYGLDTEQQTRGLGNTDIPANTTDASTFGTGGDFAYAGAGGTDYGARTGNGTRDEDELEYNAGSNASKPGMGDKIRGNLEQVAGKVSRNPGMQERGQDRKTGQF